MAVITSLLNGIPVDIVLSNEDRFKSLADTPMLMLPQNVQFLISENVTQL